MKYIKGLIIVMVLCLCTEFNSYAVSNEAVLQQLEESERQLEEINNKLDILLENNETDTTEELSWKELPDYIMTHKDQLFLFVVSLIPCLLLLVYMIVYIYKHQY